MGRILFPLLGGKVVQKAVSEENINQVHRSGGMTHRFAFASCFVKRCICHPPWLQACWSASPRLVKRFLLDKTILFHLSFMIYCNDQDVINLMLMRLFSFADLLVLDFSLHRQVVSANGNHYTRITESVYVITITINETLVVEWKCVFH